MKVKTSPCYVLVSTECLATSAVYPAYLFLVRKEELVGVHSICDGTADPGEPVEHHGRVIGVLQEHLAQHVQHHGQHDKGDEAGKGEHGSWRIGGKAAQWAGDVFEDSHGGGEVAERPWTSRRGERGELVVIKFPWRRRALGPTDPCLWTVVPSVWVNAAGDLRAAAAASLAANGGFDIREGLPSHHDAAIRNASCASPLRTWCAMKCRSRDWWHQHRR